MSDVYLPLQKLMIEYMAEDDKSIRRIFHGRGGRYEGLNWLNIDAFNNTFLLTLYQAPSAQFSLWMQALNKQCIAHHHRIIVQHRYENGTPFISLDGQEVPSECLVAQAGLKYIIKFNAQNSGLFLDMELARTWLREQAKDKKVLNLFAYTCAFSVVAIAGGAVMCVNADMSSSALSWGRQNHRSNDLTCDKVKFLAVNILKSWSKIKKYGPYDIVICDPPSFQKGSFIAQRDYPKLLKRIPELVHDGADVLMCLNAPDLDVEFLQAGVSEYCPAAKFQKRLAVPEVFADASEDKGLKILHYSM